MATLSGSTIASTYDRLLALPSGGGDTTTLVAITDGNGTNEFALKLATTSISISSTDKFYFDDGGGSGNTYIYESAADIMDFYAGGVHLLSLDDANSEVVINEGQADVNFRVEGDGEANLIFCDAGNDRVGIGTASPGVLFDVYGSVDAGDVGMKLHNGSTSGAADAKLYIATSDSSTGDPKIALSTGGGDFILGIDNSDSDKFKIARSNDDLTSNTVLTIDSSSKVGIGTASPGTHLEISEDNAITSLSLTTYSDTASHFPSIYLKKADGTEADPDKVAADNDVLGVIYFQGLDADSGGSYLNGAGIVARVNGTPTDDQMPCDLEFWTHTGSGAGSASLGDQRMTILESGNVGIGTGTPGTLLSLDTNSGDANQNNYAIEIEADEANASHNAVLKIGVGSNSNASYQRGIIQSYIADGSTEGPLTLNEDGGNVGIGTTSPAEELHVEGTGTSASVTTQTKATALTDGYGVEFKATGVEAGQTRNTNIGVYLHSGIAKPCSYMSLQPSDGAITAYLWCADNDLIMGSSTSSHIGTTSGEALSADVTSDERLKDISSDLFPYGLEAVNQLTPIKYQYNNVSEGVDRLGFGAQTLKKIIPEPVKDTKICIDGYEEDDEGMANIPRSPDKETKLVMEYSQLIPVLVKAIQELSAKVTALENA